MYPYVNIGSIRLGTYGICAAIGFFAAWWVFKADLKRRGLPVRLAGLFVVTVTLAGLVGAKVYFIFETPWALHDISRSLVQPSGLSWLGGLIAGTIALWLLSLAYKIPLLTIFDLAAPIGALVYAIGRVGCLLAGDGDYGKPTSLPWGMSFPRGLVPVFEPVHPTPIYETLFGLALFFFLWRLGAKQRPMGLLGGIYLVASGAARFLVEFIKLNPPLCFGLTNPQVVSLFCIIAGAGLLTYVLVHTSDDNVSARQAPVETPN